MTLSGSANKGSPGAELACGFSSPETGLFRDAWGIPHLRAATELELAELQGHSTARDRSWQIETDRWRAEGRLAEHIGTPGVEWDRFARRIRIADTAKRALDALDDKDRAWVDSYVAGVRVGLSIARRTEPHFAGISMNDDPWPEWAPLGVFHVAHVLFSSFPHVLWRDHVSRMLGPDGVDLFDTDGGPGSGSNAWAIHGSRTISGAPLLAGDPHRILEFPGVYQQVHLSCPEYDVVGFAFPGVPGIQHYGHTGSAAWGVTNAMAHDAEIFHERIRRRGTVVEALGPDGWETARAHVETIMVRDAAPVDVEIVETRRGPVVSRPGVSTSTGDDQAISVRQPARIKTTLGFGALRRLLRARTVEDVAHAFRDWVTPVNRVVCADRSGAVTHFTAGIVPDRIRNERRLPLNAWSPYGKEGTVALLAPPQLVLDVHVDANERPADPMFDLGYAYAPRGRADRIRSLLTETNVLETVIGQNRVFADTLSAQAGRLLAYLAAASPTSKVAATLQGRLLAWDRCFDAESHAAAEFSRWRSALVARIASHAALAPLHKPALHSAVFAPWLSVTERVGDALLALLEADALGIDGASEAAAALEEVATIDSTSPSDETSTWGDRHLLLPVPVCDDDASAVPETRLGGDTDCVLSTTSLPAVTDLCSRASVARYVWDLGDRSRSRWVVPFGASGATSSPHISDQLAAWGAVRTIPVVTDWHMLTREDL